MSGDMMTEAEALKRVQGCDCPFFYGCPCGAIQAMHYYRPEEADDDE